MSLTTMLPIFRTALSGLGLPAAAVSMGGAVRQFSSAPPSDLKSALAALIPEQQDRIRTLKKLHGSKELGITTVDQAIGGMRGIPAMLWETSLLDADEGIRFRGHSIPELQAKLPRVKEEPIPEGILWLLITGQVPTQAQAASVTEELRARAKLPPHVIKVLDALPSDAHPMTQFATGIMAMQPQSKFMSAYNKGVNKKLHWDPMYEDSMDLIANLPELAAVVYRRTYHNSKYISADPKLDWAANLSHMMGYDGETVYELFRLYQTIHSDHEGGNVSAHTCHLVGSALADPYLSFTAAMNGLAGPLHGLANQEVLFWLEDMSQTIGLNPSKAEVEKYCRDTLAKGQVVPGYGHAVLRKTDPRYTVQREFALKHLPNDPMFKLVSNLFEVVPGVLSATGKVKNPWPNVDAHSGVLLKYFGIKEASFYTVLFGVSRALGVLSQGIWSRALGLPIERPKSLTSQAIFNRFD